MFALDAGLVPSVAVFATILCIQNTPIRRIKGGGLVDLLDRKWKSIKRKAQRGIRIGMLQRRIDVGGCCVCFAKSVVTPVRGHKHAARGNEAPFEIASKANTFHPLDKGNPG